MWDPPKNEDDTPWALSNDDADAPVSSEPSAPLAAPAAGSPTSASTPPPPPMPAPSILDSATPSPEPTRRIEAPNTPPPAMLPSSPPSLTAPASPSKPEPVTITAPSVETATPTARPTPPPMPTTSPSARPESPAFSAIGAPRPPGAQPAAAPLAPTVGPRPVGAPGLPSAAVQPAVTVAEPSKRRRWPWLLLALGTIVASGLLSWFVASAAQPAPTPSVVPSAAEVTTSVPPASASAVDQVDVELLANEPFARAAEIIRPSVVRLELRQGLGTGVIINSNGTILTAAHVVGDEDTLTVIFADGSSVEGQVVGTHEPTDVAVVSVDPSGRDLVPAALADGTEVRVGQLAVAVGSPFGFDQTVTAGIISAVDRTLPGSSSASFVQTDAPINPGNSGGPLINLDGEVVGINDLIFTESGDSAGVGFAISIDLAIIIADQLVAGVEPQLALLGVSTGLPADGSAGALVQDVGPDTAADNAGIEVGDIVVRVDGTNTRNSGDLRAQIIDLPPGSEVSIAVIRDGEELELTATLGQTG